MSDDKPANMNPFTDALKALDRLVEMQNEIEQLKAENADMLAALKALVTASDGHPGSIQQRNVARAAIAKAESRS
jgi:hypothetical protein